MYFGFINHATKHVTSLKNPQFLSSHNNLIIKFNDTVLRTHYAGLLNEPTLSDG